MRAPASAAAVTFIDRRCPDPAAGGRARARRRSRTCSTTAVAVSPAAQPVGAWQWPQTIELPWLFMRPHGKAMLRVVTMVRVLPSAGGDCAPRVMVSPPRTGFSRARPSAVAGKISALGVPSGLLPLRSVRGTSTMHRRWQARSSVIGSSAHEAVPHRTSRAAIGRPQKLPLPGLVRPRMAWSKTLVVNRLPASARWPACAFGFGGSRYAIETPPPGEGRGPAGAVGDAGVHGLQGFRRPGAWRSAAVRLFRRRDQAASAAGAAAASSSIRMR